VKIIEEINYSEGVKQFITEITKYYMDFLETDFRKRRYPKRYIQFKNSNNLLIGLNLRKYPEFISSINKVITHSFDKKVIKSIPHKKYITNISKNVLDIIILQIDKINEDGVDNVLNLISKDLSNVDRNNNQDYEKILNSCFEKEKKIIKDNLIEPIIKNIGNSLGSLDGNNDDELLIIDELSTIIFGLIEDKIPEVLKYILTNNDINIINNLREVFKLNEIKSSLKVFFESYNISDLFSEIYEMEKNRTILDKQEFYFYFYDITFQNNKYPIFYIPFVPVKCNDSFEIEFDSQVYINKRAIEFISQEYNSILNQKGSISSIKERIIYLAQHQNDFSNFIDNILNEIKTFFNLDEKIDINKSSFQEIKNNYLKISNNFYIALFDKSDEALVNDYEEILNMLSNPKNSLIKTFNKLVDALYIKILNHSIVLLKMNGIIYQHLKNYYLKALFL